MVSYSQPCHIRINVNHWYVVIITIHIMLLSHFLLQNFGLFLQAIVIIVIWSEKKTSWSYEQNYVKNSRYFFLFLSSFFFRWRKNWKRGGIRRRPSFGDSINVIFISKQVYIFYKLYQIKKKQIYLSERIPYLAQTFNCSIQK